MIPKTIHYCWYGQGEQNDTIKKCIASWYKFLPEYKIKKWDETNTPFELYPFLKLLLNQKKWSFITDFMRLYSIYTEGGIYLDTDIEVIRPFNSLLNEKVFLGFQTNLNDSKYPLNSAVIGSQPKQSFIYICMYETVKKQSLSFNAMGGPPIVTKVAFKYGLKEYMNQRLGENVLILTKEYFYPFSWLEEYSDECITSDTICIHWWQDSWKNKKTGFKYIFDSVKRKIERIPLMIKSFYIYKAQKEKFFIVK